MAQESQREVIQLLFKLSDGNTQAIEELLLLIYGELRKIAGNYLRRERVSHTLLTTDN